MTATKWFSVCAVVLMIASMFAYVLTLDESIEPEPENAAEVQQSINATTTTAALQTEQQAEKK